MQIEAAAAKTERVPIHVICMGMMQRLLLLTACFVVGGPATVRAEQMLIPSPYPSEVTGAAPLDAEPMLPGPQRIMREPYPQATGSFSQGNAPIMRRHRHQRLVASTYRRRYRVERHGR